MRVLLLLAVVALAPAPAPELPDTAGGEQADLEPLARNAFRPFTNIPAGTGQSNALDISDLIHPISVKVQGTFSKTVKIEVSDDGATWTQDGADLTAAGVRALTGPAKKVRLNVTVSTSGTIAASSGAAGTIRP